MKSTRKTEQAIRKFNVRPQAEMHDKTRRDLIEAHLGHRNSRGKGVSWIACIYPILRPAVAAGIVVVALAALVCFHQFTTPPVYAIEQTVEALRNISIVHIVGRDWDDKQIEMWSKVNPETGLMDHWYVRMIDDDVIIVSTPQNTFSYEANTNTARIEDGPSVASFFRLGEFFASMNQLAERFEGQVTYSEVVDPTTKQKLIKLTMSAPKLELQSLIDPKTKLPISIDAVRGSRSSSFDMLKHATKITYDATPPEGIFDFTIPAGASVQVETIEDALADLPIEVVRHCGRVHNEAMNKAQTEGIRANTLIYFVDGTFNLRRGGFVVARNDSNDVRTGQIGVGNFDRPHLALFDAMTGRRQQIRLVQHRLTNPGRFRLFWELDEPLAPRQMRHGLYWHTVPQKLPNSDNSDQYRMRMNNYFGGEVIETFILVIPADMVVCDRSTPYVSNETIDGYDVSVWQNHLPKQAVENTVDVTLSNSGADYSADYIKQNRGEVLVEVPETFELADIAIAITEAGLNESHRVNKQGAYYKRVLEHFLPFKDHPLIADPDLTRNYGYDFRDNSICYRFEGDRIVHGDRYFNLRRPDLFERQLARLEDFARVSGFRQFYRDNQAYYAEQIERYRRNVPVRDMWTWLEERFPSRHDCYKIVFSPLVGGSHETCGFTNGGFSETIMFVSGPGESAEPIGPVEEGCLSRVVFTEIDHNYVNCVTKEHLDRVNKAFASLDKWNQQAGYRSAELTFNEYMTWAVFALYAHDKYSADEAKAILERSAVNTMERNRKFIRFGAFARELLRLYRDRNEKSIPALYPAILNWAEQVNNR